MNMSSSRERQQLRRQSSSSFVRKAVPAPIFDGVEPSVAKASKAKPTYSAISSDDPVPNSAQGGLERHFTLLDLLAIGIGGTIGSGLFVLAGLVAHQYAGPATVVSWVISGLSACISGACYAELSARVPLVGSAYAYSYVGMGELPAVVAGACLLLEYVAATAAVSRSWGDKCSVFFVKDVHVGGWLHEFLSPVGSVSPLAFLISAGITTLLLHGVQESKRVTNVFTAVKVSLVSYMIVVGFYYAKPSNWNPFIPPSLGVAGVMRG